MHSALACVHKCFTLTGHLKSAKNEYLWKKRNFTICCTPEKFWKNPSPGKNPSDSRGNVW